MKITYKFSSKEIAEMLFKHLNPNSSGVFTYSLKVVKTDNEDDYNYLEIIIDKKE